MLARLIARSRSGDVRIAVANLFWLAIERLTQVGVAIVINGVLARYFGPDIFGKWQYANTLLLVVAPITWVCGAEILVPTFVAAGVAHPTGPSDRRLIGRIFGSAFALRMAVAIAAMLVIWGGVAALGMDHMVVAMAIGLTATLVFREPFAVVTSWLAARTYSKPALLLSVTTGLAKALAVYLLARAALAPSMFGWIWALESALIAVGLTLYYRRYGQAAGPGLGWHVDGPLLKQFASAGSVFWLGLICMYGFMKIDRLMLQHYVSFAELGRYAAAQQLNENWTTLALMLAQTVAPAFIYRISDTVQLRRNLWRLLLLTGVVMSVGALIIGIFSSWVIHLVFGPGFETAAVFLRYAAWLSVPAGLEAVCNLVVLKYQAKTVLLVKWLAALATAFLCNLILIPAFGGKGALLSMGIGYAVAIAIDAVYIRGRLFERETAQ